DTPRTHYVDRTFTVQFFQPGQAKEAEGAVRALGFEIVDPRPDSALMVVRSTQKADDAIPGQLDALARAQGVRRVAPRSMRRTSNDQAAIIMGTAAALAPSSSAGLGLSGDGEVIGVCDTGLDTGNPATIHPDFTGRVLAIRSYPISPVFD